MLKTGWEELHEEQEASEGSRQIQVDVKMVFFQIVLYWQLYDLSCGLDLSPRRGNQEKNLKEGFKPEYD